MNIDDELRGTLRAYAEHAPDGQSTLAAVQAREHRIRVRRFGAGGVAALLAVAAAVSTPYLLSAHHGGSGTKPVAVAPAASPSKAPSNAPTPKVTFSHVPTTPSRVQLVPANFPQVTFPMTPHGMPSGLRSPVIGIPGLVTMLEYGGTDATSDKFMDVTSTRTKPAVDWSPDHSTTVDVNGHAATLSTGTNTDGQPGVFLTWRQHAGEWIGVEGSELTSAQVLQYARGLSDGPFAPPMPFHLALAPKGYVPAFQEFHPEYPQGEEDHFCLAPPDKINDQSSPTWVCIAINTEGAGTPQGGDPVQVGNDPGWLKDDGTVRSLQVLRPGYPFFVIQAPVAKGGTLSDSDLIRLAAGLTKS